jgi:hypothetical protein
MVRSCYDLRQNATSAYREKPDICQQKPWDDNKKTLPPSSELVSGIIVKKPHPLKYHPLPSGFFLRDERPDLSDSGPALAKLWKDWWKWGGAR